jgi:hypothetical protein
MNQSSITQDLELWEAWVEFDHLNPGRFGTLYLLGETPVNSKGKVPLIKSVDESDPRCLILTIPATETFGRVKMKEVIYAEPVNQINNYRSILVYRGDELLVEIDDIEVLI